MSNSLNVVGMSAPDDEWKKMKAAWDSCSKANREIPDQVLEYFDYESPSNYKEVDLSDSDAVEEWENGSQEGFLVDLTKLAGITHLKFYVGH